MDVYAKLSDQSMLKLYRIARQCGDFATANAIWQALKDRERAAVAWCGAVIERSIGGQSAAR